MRRKHFILGVAILWVLDPACGSGLAQDQARTGASSPPAATASAASSALVNAPAGNPGHDFEIVKIEPSEAELGKPITIEFTDFNPAWMDGNRLLIDQLVLVLGTYEMKGLRPTLIGNSHKLMVHLRSNADLADIWSNLLAEPNSRTRALPLAVGIEGRPETRVFARKAAFQIVLIPQYRFLIGLVLVALSLILFTILASRTAMLRDPYTGDLPPNQRTFSLGKTQMAVWFILVVAAFLFSWSALGDYPTIPGPILGLIGIASGTAWGLP